MVVGLLSASPAFLMGTRAVIGLGGRQEWLDGRSNRAGIKVCAMRSLRGWEVSCGHGHDFH
jgi:hypothetical protein